MKFAFWNVHQNPVINHYIVDLIYENELDIIVLAEYKDNEQKLIDELTQKGIYMEKYLTSGCDRIMMFGSIQKVMPANQNKYYSIQIIDKKCILCGMHLPSRIYSDHQERRNIVIDRIVEDINELEMKLKIENTIILGDVNENPYDVGCLNATKFHGISSGADAEKGSRTVMSKTFKMFYNPMWNLFGDFRYPPGTYYHNGSDPSNSFWNIYDQVMIRPSMRKWFVDNSLKILVKIQEYSLVDKFRHPRKDISDHLPIVFEIKEENI